MAVTHALAAFGRLIRRTPPPPADVLEAYAHEVIPVLDRAELLYQDWLEQSTLFTDSEKLGNVAAIHRWETATMGRSLERVVPPSVLAGAHESVIDALELASRAAQLLSSGSRFHNANAVCEGQSLLGTSRERRLAALKSMRRYLLQTPPAQPAEIEPGSIASTAVDQTAPAPALVDAADEAIVLAAPDPAEPTALPALADQRVAPPDVAPPPAPSAPPDADLAPPPRPQETAQTQETVARSGWGSLFDAPVDRTNE
jgi:hypothetical protein